MRPLRPNSPVQIGIAWRRAIPSRGIRRDRAKSQEFEHWNFWINEADLPHSETDLGDDFWDLGWESGTDDEEPGDE
eukprot:14554113-Heterocapsa_arctica.AAC.1